MNHLRKEHSRNNHAMNRAANTDGEQVVDVLYTWLARALGL